jgi:uncharacterized membrane protein
MEKEEIQSDNENAEKDLVDLTEQEESDALLDIVTEEQPEIGEVIRNNPKFERLVKENPDVLSLIKISQVSHHRGPLPSPKILDEYNQTLPGLAETIVGMALADAEHRRTMDSKVLEAQKRDNLLGQIFGFLIGTIAIIAGAVTSVSGAQVFGTVLGAGGVSALVAVFVLGRKPKSDD